MIRAGFLIDSMGPSQQSIYLTSSVNTLVAQKPNYSVCAFYRNFGPIVVSPHFALFTEYEAWNFDGIAIATDLRSANALLNCPGPVKKFFYVWETEWAFLDNYQYADMAKVYQSEEMPLIVRSRFHYDIVSRLWQPPKEIIEDFNHEQIAKFLADESGEVRYVETGTEAKVPE